MSTTTTTAHDTATAITSLLRDHGQSDYIGERISQLAHSLQCAHLASTHTSDPDTILAGLLHDIGQFLPEAQVQQLAGEVQHLRSSDNETGSVGRVGHEDIGALYLNSLGFSAKVCALVAAHVPAKRYLCAVEPAYHDTLSEASKTSLRLQGGPMSEAEVKQWKSGQWSEEMCRLRKWDDEAKVVDLKVPGVEAYDGLIEEHLEAVGKGQR